jgi:hypothetical protein
MSVGPVLKTVVLFVRDSSRSGDFYCHLLGLRKEVEEPEAVMLVSSAGTRVYLRQMARAVRATVSVGILLGAWVLATQSELERAERYLKDNNAWISTGAVAGMTVIEGRDPDQLPICWRFPSWPKSPRRSSSGSITTDWAGGLTGVASDQQIPIGDLLEQIWFGLFRGVKGHCWTPLHFESWFAGR